MSNDNIFVAALASFAILIVASVLRPKHLQRSVIEIKDNIIHGICYKGKAMVNGVQKPFAGAAVSLGFTGIR